MELEVFLLSFDLTFVTFQQLFVSTAVPMDLISVSFNCCIFYNIVAKVKNNKAMS